MVIALFGTWRAREITSITARLACPSAGGAVTRTCSTPSGPSVTSLRLARGVTRSDSSVLDLLPGHANRGGCGNKRL